MDGGVEGGVEVGALVGAEVGGALGTGGVELAERDAGVELAVGRVLGVEGTASWTVERASAGACTAFCACAASTAGSTEESSVLVGSGPASELWGAGPIAAPSAMPTAKSAAASAPLTLIEGSRRPVFWGVEGSGSLMVWTSVGAGA